MLIAICDDEPMLCNFLKNELYFYFNEHNIDAVVETYGDGHSLLNASQRFELIILDYQMPGINGLQTAKEIRSVNKNCTILFLTSFPEIVYDTFEYDTFRFLIKPLDKEKLYEALDSFRQKTNFFYPISLTIDGEFCKIESKEIVYIEANGKNSVIRLIDKSLCCSKTLSNVFSMLPKNCFCKTHRAFVVNLAFVEQYDKKRIIFTNGEYAKISRNLYVDFKKALNTYLIDFTV